MTVLVLLYLAKERIEAITSWLLKYTGPGFGVFGTPGSFQSPDQSHASFWATFMCYNSLQLTKTSADSCLTFLTPTIVQEAK